MDGDVSLVMRCTDEPRVSCSSTSASVGQLGACLRCLVDARPPPHAVFWASDSAGTNLAAVAPPTAYWNVIRVRTTTPRPGLKTRSHRRD